MNLLAQHWAEVWIPGSVGLLITGLPMVYALRLIFLGHACQKWPTVPGQITGSEYVERVPPSRSRHGSARITFRFEVDGQERMSNNVRYGHGMEANPWVAMELVKRFPVGTEVPIRVRGREAVLLPGPSGWLYIVALICMFIFGAILYQLIRST